MYNGLLINSRESKWAVKIPTWLLKQKQFEIQIRLISETILNYYKFRRKNEALEKQILKMTK